MTEPGGTYSPVIHSPIRLRACGILRHSGMTEFSVLRDVLNVSDSVLSKHVKHLEDAGLATVSKGVRDSRPRTWIELTATGEAAFAAHVAFLESAMVGRA